MKRICIIIMMLAIFFNVTGALAADEMLPVKLDIMTVDITETDENTYFENGIALYEQEKYQEALEQFEQEIALNPDHGECYAYKGGCLFYLKRVDDALAAFEQSIAIQPHYNPYEWKGICLFMQGDAESALAAFEESIKLYSYDKNNFYKGMMLIALERYQEAADTYDIIINMDVDPYIIALSYNNKAKALWYLEKYDEAMVAVTRGIGIDTSQAVLYKNKGLILEGQGKDGQALSAYYHALSLDDTYEKAIAAKEALLAKIDDTLDGIKYRKWDDVKKNISLNKEWMVQFNVSVDLESINHDNIYIEDLEGMLIPTAVTMNETGRKVTIALANEAQYQPGESYFLYITDNVRDLDGKRLIKGVRMLFTTEEAS